MFINDSLTVFFLMKERHWQKKKKRHSIVLFPLSTLYGKVLSYSNISKEGLNLCCFFFFFLDIVDISFVSVA